MELYTHRANRYDLGETLLEVGLVICSITLLTKRRSFWIAGIVVWNSGGGADHDGSDAPLISLVSISRDRPPRNEVAFLLARSALELTLPRDLRSFPGSSPGNSTRRLSLRWPWRLVCPRRGPPWFQCESAREPWPACAACKAAANLKLCAGTTRSS